MHRLSASQPHINVFLLLCALPLLIHYGPINSCSLSLRALVVSRLFQDAFRLDVFLHSPRLLRNSSIPAFHTSTSATCPCCPCVWILWVRLLLQACLSALLFVKPPVLSVVSPPATTACISYLNSAPQNQ